MRRPRGGQVGLLLLAYQISRVGLQYIPPVTLGFIILQVAIHYLVDWDLRQVCMGADYVWFSVAFEYPRLILHSLFHVDDIHLYYNMSSFLWKGLILERLLGSKRFFLLISLFIVLTSGIMVLISRALVEFDYSVPFYSCAVGFSSVLFALKVVSTRMSPQGPTAVMGILVPDKYIAWVELLLIQIIAPQSSFFGHLCGILAGMLYLTGIFDVMLDVGETLLSAVIPPDLGEPGAHRQPHHTPHQRYSPTAHTSPRRDPPPSHQTYGRRYIRDGVLQ